MVKQKERPRSAEARPPESLPWSERPMEEVELIGGELCLDFANSVGGTRQEPKERIHGYPDLVAWGAHAGAIGEEEAEVLQGGAAARPAEAEGVLDRARELREAIFRIFRAVAVGERPAAGDLERLNAELERALGRLRVAPEGDGYDWRFAGEAALDRVLWTIARSAAELLVSDDLERVKQCGGHDCNWLFVDRSKNKSRRWCDMRDCGNRAKARRYYRRQRAGG